MKYLIDINDAIGGWFGFSKNDIKRSLAASGGQPANVRISSLGGEVATALDIFQQFRDHGKLTAYLFSFVASSATVIAMGCQKVVMSRHALFLVHQCSSWVDLWGQMNKEQVQETIARLEEEKRDLEKVDLTVASIYSERTGKSIAEIHDLMKEAKWLSADEAKALGFVDEILEDKPQVMDAVNMIQGRLERIGLPALPEGRLDVIGVQDEGEAPAQEEGKTNIHTEMKNFVNLAALLALTGIAFTDGVASLSEEQVQQIEDFLAKNKAEIEKLQAEVAAKQTDIDELNAQVEALKKADADDDDPLHDDADSFTPVDLFNEVKDLI